MQIKIFTVSVFNTEEQSNELNTFLRSHTIIDIEKYLLSELQTPAWTFCIRYKEGTQQKTKIKSKVDYKEILDEKIFNIFSQLRSSRKKLAEKHGVPVYAIFTNEELANIAGLKNICLTDMQKIKGIGIKKVEKYGKSLLELFENEQ